MPSFAKFFYFFGGLAVVGIGLLTGLVGVISILDPVGAKMSDDSDPFGSTRGIVLGGVVILAIGIAITIGGFFLITRMDRK